MSRLAALSSNLDIYKQSVEELASTYLSREYPLNMVKDWITLNYYERWETRYRVVKHTGTENIMVVKSILNPIWDFIDVRNVQKGIQDTWEGSEIPSKLLEATLIISRKWTMNFGDLVQHFNATYLESFPDVTTLGDLFQSLHL